MELHESLAELGASFGLDVFDEPDGFRAALDDYLDEDSASTGDINLLVDAVRLGAFRMLLTMLHNGAEAPRAIEAAGNLLARDRGSADVAGSRWACAVLGFAVGKVGDADVRRYRSLGSAPTWHLPIAETRPRPPGPPPTYSPTGPPPAPPHRSEPPAPWPGHPVAPAPVGQNQPPPKKSRTGLIIGGLVGAVLLIGAVVGGVLLATSGGDDSNDRASDSSSEDSTDSTEDSEPTDEPTDAAPAGPVLPGDGYSYELPVEWTNVTDQVLATNPGGAIDTVSSWGVDIPSGRANVITEKDNSGGVSDPEDLRSTWQANLESGVGVAPVPGEDTEIAGEKAITATLSSTNAEGLQIEQSAYLVVVDDSIYSIALSAEAGDTGAVDTFTKILESWSWE
ncbi:MAG: hypothetical protein WKF79_07280 [Nocardioides sp.]